MLTHENLLMRFFLPSSFYSNFPLLFNTISSNSNAFDQGTHGRWHCTQSTEILSIQRDAQFYILKCSPSLENRKMNFNPTQ